MRPGRVLGSRFRGTRAATAVLFWIAFVMGCNNGPPTAEISGTVTLDGEPLDDAVVQVDAGDGAVPTSLDIKAGQFAGEVLLGSKTLRFFAMRPTKRDPRLRSIDMQAPFENVLPDRYGYSSESRSMSLPMVKRGFHTI